METKIEIRLLCKVKAVEVNQRSAIIPDNLDKFLINWFNGKIVAKELR